MAFPTMGAITEKFVGQPYDLNSVLTPAQVWAKLDSPPEEVRVALNAVVALLNAITDGISGADSLGIPETIAGSGANVRDRADWLYAQIVAAVLGEIPDGSLTTAKHANSSVTAAKCAADVATQAELDNLAGAGRTTETVKDNADTIANHSANTTTAHGAVSAATASKIIIRDASGRAKVAAPSATDDIALLSTVTGNVEDTPTAGHTTNAASSNSVAILQADYATDTGVVNAYAITLNPAPVAYEIGKIYKFKAANANTGASTFAIGALVATAIKKNVSVALAAGDIPAGGIIPVMYDGTNFQLIPIAPPSAASETVAGITEYATAAEVTAGVSTTLAITPAGAKVELDKKANITSGGYTGNATSPRTISLSFTPKFVYVTRLGGSTPTDSVTGITGYDATAPTLGKYDTSNSNIASYLAGDNNSIVITTNGFIVRHNSTYNGYNINGISYGYTAIG